MEYNLGNNGHNTQHLYFKFLTIFPLLASIVTYANVANLELVYTIDARVTLLASANISSELRQL